MFKILETFFSFKDPWNCCSYKCGVCNATSDGRNKLRSHVVQKHKMEYKQYLVQYGNPALSIVKVLKFYLKCVPC